MFSFVIKDLCSCKTRKNIRDVEECVKMGLGKLQKGWIKS